MRAFLAVLAKWHSGMGLLRKELAVWFGADPRSAGLPYHPSHTVPLPALVTKAQQPATMRKFTENSDSLRSSITSFSSHSASTHP